MTERTDAPARRSWLRRMLGFGILAGAAYALWRAIAANHAGDDRAWEPQPFPFPPQPKPDEPAHRGTSD